MDILANRLKYLRENKRLSQKEVAAEIGVSLNAYQKWEYGDRDPKLEVLIKFAEFYNVTTDYLLGLTDVEDEIASRFSEKAITVMIARNEMLANNLQFEHLKSSEGKDAAVTMYAQKQYYEAKNHYSKLLYSYMNDYFYIDNANPYEDVVLEDKFPIQFKVDIDIFGGYIVNVECADGTIMEKVKYIHDTIYAGGMNAEDKAMEYIDKMKEHFRMK